MADSTGLPDDFEDQRKLAATYEPTLTGPNVSTKKSLNELVQRYAGGHQAYQAKTKVDYRSDGKVYMYSPLTTLQNLAQRYSSLRFIKGDRKCGWRGTTTDQTVVRGGTHKTNRLTALAFVYCELLVKLEDETRIRSEKARLASLAPEMDILGDTHRGLYEDMCLDAFNELFDKLDSWKGTADASGNLQAYFDTDDVAHVLYGLRLLAALAMKKEESFYGMFLEGGVDEYCNKVLLLPDEEIEESGLRALNDILISPAGLSLEVLILHDNPGTDVDITNYPPPAKPAQGTLFPPDSPPTVRLLFTPGHYDIIYKPSDDPVLIARVQIPQTHWSSCIQSERPKGRVIPLANLGTSPQNSVVQKPSVRPSYRTGLAAESWDTSSDGQARAGSAEFRARTTTKAIDIDAWMNDLTSGQPSDSGSALGESPVALSPVPHADPS